MTYPVLPFEPSVIVPKFVPFERINNTTSSHDFMLKQILFLPGRSKEASS